MDDLRVGTIVRQVRIKKGWRQLDLARKAKVSPSTVSRIERGHLDLARVGTLRRVCHALEIMVDINVRYRAGDLDRLLNAKHSALHEAVAEMFEAELPAWTTEHEVSFAIYADRGVIDIVAWHAGRRALLIIELKTDVVDVNDLMATMDQRRRLARQIVKDRGWDPVTVSTWVVIANSRTNRKRVATHSAVLRTAFPRDGRSMAAYLADPAERIDALSFWYRPTKATGGPATPIRRVRPRRKPTPT
jgi:transcriptional regulator with XRE-family HTH domain